MSKLKTILLILLLSSLASASEKALSPGEQTSVSVPIDGDSPIIKIINPQNIPYNNLTSILVNFTVIDLSLNSIWYTLNNNPNTTITSPFYLNLSEGPYILRIYANDSLGRTNYSEISFEVNNSIPACGDGLCDSAESCSICPNDCGSCQPPGEGGGGGGGGGEGGGERSTPPEIPDEVEIDRQEEQLVGETGEETEPEPPIKQVPLPKTSDYIIMLLIIIMIFFISKNKNIFTKIMTKFRIKSRTTKDI